MHKTQQEIVCQGYDVLIQNLGIVGTLNFLQHFNSGQGDYSQERHQSPEPTLDEIFHKMEQLPEPNLEHYKEII